MKLFPLYLPQSAARQGVTSAISVATKESKSYVFMIMPHSRSYTYRYLSTVTRYLLSSYKLYEDCSSPSNVFYFLHIIQAITDDANKYNRPADWLSSLAFLLPELAP
jgi:hypothetical protein